MHARLVVPVVLLLVMACGCGSDAAPQAGLKTQGTVTFDGEPLGDATLVLSRDGQRYTAAVRAGQVQLTAADGLVAGTYDGSLEPPRATAQEVEQSRVIGQPRQFAAASLPPALTEPGAFTVELLADQPFVVELTTP